VQREGEGKKEGKKEGGGMVFVFIKRKYYTYTQQQNIV
jgi:hypothetical protein